MRSHPLHALRTEVRGDIDRWLAIDLQRGIVGEVGAAIALSTVTWTRCVAPQMRG